jgi:hypothetical protein
MADPKYVPIDQRPPETNPISDLISSASNLMLLAWESAHDFVFEPQHRYNTVDTGPDATKEQQPSSTTANIQDDNNSIVLDERSTGSKIGAPRNTYEGSFRERKLKKEA